MSSVPKYNPRYTKDDYLGWSGDWELIDGVAISMSPSPMGPHQLAATRTITYLSNQITANGSYGDCVVLSELDWIMNDSTVVRPDILITCGGCPDRHLTNTPELIVEILSSATADKDRTVKFDLYQQHGVKNYLLINPSDATTEVFALDSQTYSKCDPTKNIHELQLHDNCFVEFDSRYLAG